MAANVVKCFRVCLGLDVAISPLDQDPERIYPFSSDDVRSRTGKMSICSTESDSLESCSLGEFNERTSKSIHFETKQTNTIQIMNEDNGNLKNKSSLAVQVVADSLDVLYEKLEKMEQTNTTQFRKMIDKNEEADKNFKEIKESMKFQLQGLRRRVESLNKKTN